MATAMLENGADVRFVQEMLGHVSLAKTQIYTRVSIKKLKEVHSLTHPSAKLRRHAAGPGDPGLDEPELETMFAALDAEDDER